MHQTLPWLLLGLVVAAVGAWRVSAALRRSREMRTEREAAMAIALAEAHRAARAAAAKRTAASKTDAARPRVAPPRAAPSSARIDAARIIATEAARRQAAQKSARVESERRVAPPAPVAEVAPPAVARAPVRPPAAARPPVVAPVVAKAPAAPAPAPPVPAPAPTPIARSPAPEAAAAIPAPPVAAPVSAKAPAETLILLVDDSKMVRVKTSRLLEANGYRVATAVDGLDGIRQLESCQPDLVITDVDMPGMDGFGFTQHLRGNARTARVPIVMITSAEDRHREAAHAAGVGLVLGKPYPEDELLAHIRSFRFTGAAVTA